MDPTFKWIFGSKYVYVFMFVFAAAAGSYIPLSSDILIVGSIYHDNSTFNVFEVSESSLSREQRFSGGGSGSARETYPNDVVTVSCYISSPTVGSIPVYYVQLASTTLDSLATPRYGSVFGDFYANFNIFTGEVVKQGADVLDCGILPVKDRLYKIYITGRASYLLSLAMPQENSFQLYSLETGEEERMPTARVGVDNKSYLILNPQFEFGYLSSTIKSQTTTPTIGTRLGDSFNRINVSNVTSATSGSIEATVIFNENDYVEALGYSQQVSGQTKVKISWRDGVAGFYVKSGQSAALAC